MRAGRVCLAALGLGLAACGPTAGDGAGTGAGGDAGGVATAGEASGPAHPLPSGAPDRFGFGGPASEERIARWDVDVRPDGAGLPNGSGSVERGAEVYARSCAACHGATGDEGPNDRLVGGEWPEGGFPRGRTVGSYWPYATTLFDYVRRAMPQDRPGSLAAGDTYAVIAWILWRNGLVPEDAVLDASALPEVRMPARDRFVPDDRLEGSDVR